MFIVNEYQRIMNTNINNFFKILCYYLRLSLELLLKAIMFLLFNSKYLSNRSTIFINYTIDFIFFACSKGSKNTTREILKTDGCS